MRAGAAAFVITLLALSSSAHAAPGVPAAVVFETQPVSSEAGRPLPLVTVKIVDDVGQVCSVARSVSLGIGTNPGGTWLRGTTVRTTVAGRASFGDLAITVAGLGYTLRASSTG